MNKAIFCYIQVCCSEQWTSHQTAVNNKAIVSRQSFILHSDTNLTDDAH